MKFQTKLVIIAVIVLICVMLSSCQEDNSSKPVLDDGGEYTGFSDISHGYNASDAAADGCLVIDTVQGTNEYGATVTEKCETAGYENWQSFLEKTESGKDAFLRVTHFIDGVGYYHDLYYSDGKYSIFEYNENGVSKGEIYRYLRRLDGYAGPSYDLKEDSIYVLTDSMELTYDEVSRSFFSSDLSTVTGIRYKWLGFMVYFE